MNKLDTDIMMVGEQNDVFQVEEIETIAFDENGQEHGTWKGFAVTKIDNPANYCYECRDKINADNLCEYLNSISFLDEPVSANLNEWSECISSLSKKEKELLELKDSIFDKEQWIIENTDFQKVYGKNNADVRKQHFKKHMKGKYENRRKLEGDIDYLKRRISFLKQLVYTKTVLIDVKK